jgi:hypothetical protein
LQPSEGICHDRFEDRPGRRRHVDRAGVAHRLHEARGGHDDHTRLEQHVLQHDPGRGHVRQHHAGREPEQQHVEQRHVDAAVHELHHAGQHVLEHLGNQPVDLRVDEHGTWLDERHGLHRLGELERHGLVVAEHLERDERRERGFELSLSGALCPPFY